jgi:hypothetical protein
MQYCRVLERLGLVDFFRNAIMTVKFLMKGNCMKKIILASILALSSSVFATGTAAPAAPAAAAHAETTKANDAKAAAHAGGKAAAPHAMNAGKKAMEKIDCTKAENKENAHCKTTTK